MAAGRNPSDLAALGHLPLTREALRPPCQRVTPRCAGRCRGATEGAGPEGLSAAADWGIPPRGPPDIYVYILNTAPFDAARAAVV